MSWPKIILFGDSITQYSFGEDGCWGTLLVDYYQRRCDVLARGFSGYNTRWCKIILPSILNTDMAKETVAMTVFLGANDSNDGELNPRQHVPLEEYESIKLSKDNETTGIYAQACCKVADEMGTQKVDLYSNMMSNTDFASYLNDGLHLSVEGSKLLFNLLLPILNKLTSHIKVKC